MNTIPATADVVADRSLVGTALADAYTAEVDAWLGSVIDEVGDLPGFALAAVGGYGRGDLSPGSDLDLLLVHQIEGSAAIVAERIWYPIWDSGMKLGHAVRTIDEASLPVSRRDSPQARIATDAVPRSGTRRSNR